jgi:hypothetical protein
MTINLKDLFKISPELNDKVVLKLLTALKEGQEKDFDYLKFKLSYTNLLQMGMDEATAAKSAFVTAATMGVTKEKLLTSLQHYKNIMARQREEFAFALKNQIANNVDAKTIEINRLNDKYDENIRKIEQINREQLGIKEEVTKLEAASLVSQEKINETRDQFKATFDALYEELEGDGTLYHQIL